ncbi:MAG: hypothetical protein K9M80_01185 [Candidatus Marinimicrobia bacterium]|nr:hypothetical protein [Candidatus Neomarinimicrobiota bacterium]
MGRAELILVFGAIVIFGIYSLTILDMQLQNRIANINRKYEDAAVSLAHSYLNMAGNEKFDEHVDSDGKLPPGASFTSPDSLGNESGETDLNSFDDLDDYIGLSDSTLSITFYDSDSIIYQFEVDFSAEYVNLVSGSWTTSANITNNKKLTMRINSDYLPSEVVFSRVMSYK